MNKKSLLAGVLMLCVFSAQAADNVIANWVNKTNGSVFKIEADTGSSTVTVNGVISGATISGGSYSSASVTAGSLTAQSNLNISVGAIAVTNLQAVAVGSNSFVVLTSSYRDSTNLLSNPAAAGQLLVIANGGTNNIILNDSGNLTLDGNKTLLGTTSFLRDTIMLIAQTATNWIQVPAFSGDRTFPANVTVSSNITVTGNATVLGRAPILGFSSTNYVLEFGQGTNGQVVTFTTPFTVAPSITFGAGSGTTNVFWSNKNPTNFTINATPVTAVVDWHAAGVK